MGQDRRYFVRTFATDRQGELKEANLMELPSEDSALYAARVGGIEKAGAVALVCAVGPDGQLRVDMLRRYGSLPKDALDPAFLAAPA